MRFSLILGARFGAALCVKEGNSTLTRSRGVESIDNLKFLLCGDADFLQSVARVGYVYNSYQELLTYVVLSPVQGIRAHG